MKFSSFKLKVRCFALAVAWSEPEDALSSSSFLLSLVFYSDSSISVGTVDCPASLASLGVFQLPESPSCFYIYSAIFLILFEASKWESSCCQNCRSMLEKTCLGRMTSCTSGVNWLLSMPESFLMILISR